MTGPAAITTERIRHAWNQVSFPGGCIRADRQRACHALSDAGRGIAPARRECSFACHALPGDLRSAIERVGYRVWTLNPRRTLASR